MATAELRVVVKLRRKLCNAWSIAYKAYASSLVRLEDQLAQLRTSFFLGASARKDTLELFAYRVMRQNHYLEALQSEQADGKNCFLGPEGPTGMLNFCSPIYGQIARLEDSPIGPSPCA